MPQAIYGRHLPLAKDMKPLRHGMDHGNVDAYSSRKEDANSSVHVRLISWRLALQIPQVLAGTTAPLLIQQLMHMQLGQQQLQLGQQGVPLNYWQQHPSLPAESAAAARRFAQAYSQPANGQPAEGTQAARPRATQVIQVWRSFFLRPLPTSTPPQASASLITWRAARCSDRCLPVFDSVCLFRQSGMLPFVPDANVHVPDANADEPDLSITCGRVDNEPEKQVQRAQSLACLADGHTFAAMAGSEASAAAAAVRGNGCWGDQRDSGRAAALVGSRAEWGLALAAFAARGGGRSGEEGAAAEQVHGRALAALHSLLAEPGKQRHIGSCSRSR